MQTCVIYEKICSGCGGRGEMPGALPSDPTSTCSMCDGTGKEISGTMEMDVPTTAQFAQFQSDVTDALTAIWNKVKDL